MKVATLWMFWLFWTEYSRTDDSYLRYFFAYFLLESSDRSVIWSWVGLSQKWSKVQVILHQRDAFLENLKEFNGLLTYLPHVDMNSPFPVIKVLDMLQDEKLPNNKTWSKITFVVIEELFLSQQALHSKKKGFLRVSTVSFAEFCSKNQPRHQGAVSVGRPAMTEAMDLLAASQNERGGRRWLQVNPEQNTQNYGNFRWFCVLEGV